MIVTGKPLLSMHGKNNMCLTVNVFHKFVTMRRERSQRKVGQENDGSVCTCTNLSRSQNPVNWFNSFNQTGVHTYREVGAEYAKSKKYKFHNYHKMATKF